MDVDWIGTLVEGDRVLIKLLDYNDVPCEAFVVRFTKTQVLVRQVTAGNVDGLTGVRRFRKSDGFEIGSGIQAHLARWNEQAAATYRAHQTHRGLVARLNNVRWQAFSEDQLRRVLAIVQE